MIEIRLDSRPVIRPAHNHKTIRARIMIRTKGGDI